MRLFPILLISLLLAVPGWAQSQRGQVDKAATTDLPTCNAGLIGYRAYDSTLGLEVTCNGQGGIWVPSGGTGGPRYIPRPDGSSISAGEARRGCFNVVYTLAGAFDITLPDVTAANVGMCVTIAATTANSVCIEVGDVGNEIVLDGTGITAGDTLDSGGVAGEIITLHAVAEDVWAAHSNGSWVDGGAACP